VSHSSLVNLRRSFGVELFAEGGEYSGYPNGYVEDNWIACGFPPQRTFSQAYIPYGPGGGNWEEWLAAAYCYTRGACWCSRNVANRSSSAHGHAVFRTLLTKLPSQRDAFSTGLLHMPEYVTRLAEMRPRFWAPPRTYWPGVVTLDLSRLGAKADTRNAASGRDRERLWFLREGR